MNQDTDHDLLVSIHANLTNAMVELKRLNEKFEKHEAEDRSSFGTINKVVWMGLGAVALLQVFISLKLASR